MIYTLLLQVIFCKQTKKKRNEITIICKQKSNLIKNNLLQRARTRFVAIKKTLKPINKK